MDKKNLLSNGKIEFVPLEYENDFFKDLKKNNLTAQLISDVPGKSLGTSPSQNNQLQINEDLKIDLSTGKVVSKHQQKEDTESKSEDTSLVSYIHEGQLYEIESKDNLSSYKKIEALKTKNEASKKILYSNHGLQGWKELKEKDYVGMAIQITRALTGPFIPAYEQEKIHVRSGTLMGL